MIKEFKYPSPAEIDRRIVAGELALVYARDEQNGFIYVTLKECHHENLQPLRTR